MSVAICRSRAAHKQPHVGVLCVRRVKALGAKSESSGYTCVYVYVYVYVYVCLCFVQYYVFFRYVLCNIMCFFGMFCAILSCYRHGLCYIIVLSVYFVQYYPIIGMFCAT